MKSILIRLNPNYEYSNQYFNAQKTCTNISNSVAAAQIQQLMKTQVKKLSTQD